MAVSSFHTISINFSLSLALYKYHCFLSVFPCLVGRFFGTLVRTAGPHAFMTCIMMKRKPQLKRFSISANNIAFSCTSIFMWAFICVLRVCNALNVRLPFALLLHSCLVSVSIVGHSLFSDNRSLADTLTACQSYVLVSNINRFVKRFQ